MHVIKKDTFFQWNGKHETQNSIGEMTENLINAVLLTNFIFPKIKSGIPVLAIYLYTTESPIPKSMKKDHYCA